MKALNGYANASSYSEREKIPAGGYVARINDVKIQQTSWGETMVLSFDIVEGEYKDFFARDYQAQTGKDKKWRGTYRLTIPADDGSEKDEWTMRRFKGAMKSFETSNPGYHWNWDEESLKGKMIGTIFNEKEYDINGYHGFSPRCYSLTDADKIRSGKFKVPDPTMLKKKNDAPDDGFMTIPDLKGQLPFD